MKNQTPLPQTLKGFRDFLPSEMKKRDYVKQKVVTIFERFGFEPLETPTLEYASLLLGKYGAEADKLIYSFADKGERRIGLRYDQTVPTARVLAQYQHKLPKYFRRYQIQNVFRADKPQKGRYREFTQCDIDIFGTSNPLSDAEIVACTYFAYRQVGFPSIILKINDRQTLFDTLSEFATDTVSVFSIIQSIDKLDKISAADIAQELVGKGLTPQVAERVLHAIQSAQMSPNLQNIVALCQELGVPKTSLVFTPTLARGLDYYTGMIFEVSVPEYGASSLGGGGRYDKLINQLGGNDIPAVGIAFGFDRMVEAAELLGLLPKEATTTKVLVTIFDEDCRSASLQTTAALRKAGIATELYPELDKLAKQFKYADQKQIPYVVVIGPEEKDRGVVQLKEMASGQQQTLSLANVIDSISPRGNTLA